MSTVAIQLMIKSLLPTAVLMPADRSAVLNLLWRLVKTPSAALEAASKDIVARMEVNALATIARGMQQLRIFMPLVAVVRSKARMYAMARKSDKCPYDGIETSPWEPCKPVESSFRPVDGLKLNPKWGVVQVTEEFVSVQDVKREIVVHFPIPREEAVALDPTKSVPVSFDRSERYVELDNFEEMESASVFALDGQYDSNKS
jgi:hypothetical protein